ncbi:hypothetical protein ABZZ80_26445, partial [Streptomyces sp. NPDC006356]
DVAPAPVPQQATPPGEQRPELVATPEQEQPEQPEYVQDWFNTPRNVEYQGGYDPAYNTQEQYDQWYQEQLQAEQYQEQFQEEPPVQEPSPEDTGTFPIPVSPNRTRQLGEGGGTPEPTEEDYYLVFRESIKSGNGAPTHRGLIADVEATYGVTLDESEAKRMVNRFSNRYNAELTDEHIA